MRRSLTRGHILMGSCNRRSCHVVVVIIITHVIFPSFPSLLSPVHGQTVLYDPESLDSQILKYAKEAQEKERTGSLLKISLPANFSGMEVSVLRLRSRHFWERGANFSPFYIPPRVLPFPFVKRIAMVHRNLGNWSSDYYPVPGYSLVAPVVGFTAYDASNSSALGNKPLDFRVLGNPILISFPKLVTKGNLPLKCVKLGPRGMVQFMNITNGNTCIAQGDGQFSVVVPNPEVKKESNVWIRWVVGLGAGFIALVLLVLIVFATFKLVRRKRFRKMEAESEKGVGLDTTWIGKTKLPSASMVRTQPILEQEFVA